MLYGTYTFHYWHNTVAINFYHAFIMFPTIDTGSRTTICTINPVSVTVSREYATKLADNYMYIQYMYSEVPDKNDGKEVVILPEKR